MVFIPIIIKFSDNKLVVDLSNINVQDALSNLQLIIGRLNPFSWFCKKNDTEVE